MNTEIEAHASITGLLLAGGRAERMGGCDKGLLVLADEPLIAHSLRRLKPQVSALLISANRNHGQYQSFGYPVIGDDPNYKFRGPLAGILAAMVVAQTPYILTAPCDSPLLAPNYAQRLLAGLKNADATISVGFHAGFWQPVFALLPVCLRDDLAQWLAADQGGVWRWLQRHQAATVEFPDYPEMFINANTAEELAQLEICVKSIVLGQ